MAVLRLVAVSLVFGLAMVLLIGVFVRPAETFGLLAYFLICSLINNYGLRLILPILAFMGLALAVNGKGPKP